MIFVTVGNAPQGFKRLVEAIDRLCGEGAFGDQDVFIQYGATPDFKPQHAEGSAFLPVQEFNRRLETADLVITHGGCTVLQVIRSGKCPVVMPRDPARGEHINDHQVSFVLALAKDEWVAPAFEASELRAAMEKALRKPRRAATLAPSPIHFYVRRAIEDLMREAA